MILINGNFLCRNLTGIERFAYETCARLDSLLGRNDETALLLPDNARSVPAYKNIRIVRAGASITSFPLWDLFFFPRVCKKMHATALNFSNTAPLGKQCGYAFLHDIYAKDVPQDFVSKKDRLIQLYSLLNYRNIAKNAKAILTVSQFSKNRIKQAYAVDDSRISVIPNGWEHFRDIEEDDRIFGRLPPSVQRGGYFFTLGSLQKRKNLQWICSYAQKHPESLFVVSGKAIGGMHSEAASALRSSPNIVPAGYATDGEVKALMRWCRAFVFPSYYEGFGIPPLEALSVGAKIIVAHSASLPEIYGKTAAYIDAYSTDCNLNEAARAETEDASSVLAKYTYQHAAEKLHEILFPKLST